MNMYRIGINNAPRFVSAVLGDAHETVCPGHGPSGYFSAIEAPSGDRSWRA
jgi:hypothetical protein